MLPRDFNSFFCLNGLILHDVCFICPAWCSDNTSKYISVIAFSSMWRFSVAVTRWSQINAVDLHWARLVLGRVMDGLRNQPPGPTQPGHPSVGRRNEYWRWLRPPLREENVEFCVAVAPATRTPGILIQLAKGAGC